jgi:aconitate hydratase
LVDPKSDRLQLLKPFEPWNGEEFENLPILIKAKGKCTTDHISMAGPWLKYRGHLENISGNLYLGVVNAFRDGMVGKGKNQLNGEIEEFPAIAKAYHEQKQLWVAIGDENMGEGSSREHAAMEPRFRGAALIIAKSFARIHETNLKKQGVVPLTFAVATDYDKIEEDDRLSTINIVELAPSQPVQIKVTKSDGSSWQFECNHTFSPEQIEWFHKGSALAVIQEKL